MINSYYPQVAESGSVFDIKAPVAFGEAGCVSLRHDFFGVPQPELEEHILFVLHPMWAEKGDLL